MEDGLEEEVGLAYWQQIKVCNPSVQGYLHTKHVSYQVVTPDSNGTDLTVRRYGDFCWLAERLQIERAGAAVYPLPAKQKGKTRFTDQFIESRRAQLEIFLQRAYRNLELNDSPSLDVFLHTNNTCFDTIADAKTDEILVELLTQFSSIKVEKDPAQFNLEHGYTSLLTKRVAVKASTVTHKYDDIFEEARLEVEVLESQLKLVVTQVSNWVQRSEGSGKGLLGLGSAFRKIALAETTDKLAFSCEQLGLVTKEQSTITLDYAKGTKEELERPLICFIFVLLGMRMTFNNRAEKRMEYAIWLHHVAKKEGYAEKVTNQADALNASAEPEEQDVENALTAAAEEEELEDAVAKELKQEAAANEERKVEAAVTEELVGQDLTRDAAAAEETEEEAAAAALAAAAVLEAAKENEEDRAPATLEDKVLTLAEKSAIFMKEKAVKKALFMKDKAEKAKLSLESERSGAESMRLAYEAMNDRLYRELGRFNEEKGDLMSAIIRQFAEHEAQYHRTMEQKWNGLLPILSTFSPTSPEIEEEVVEEIEVAIEEEEIKDAIQVKEIKDAIQVEEMKDAIEEEEIKEEIKDAIEEVKIKEGIKDAIEEEEIKNAILA